MACRKTKATANAEKTHGDDKGDGKCLAYGEFTYMCTEWLWWRETVAAGCVVATSRFCVILATLIEKLEQMCSSHRT